MGDMHVSAKSGARYRHREIDVHTARQHRWHQAFVKIVLFSTIWQLLKYKLTSMPQLTV